MSVVIYLTKRCNYKCSYCYAESSLNPKNFENDLTLEQLRELMKSPYGQSALRVGLLGGEPFLNKEIFTFVDELKKNRKIVTIVSNASLIRGETLEALKKSPLDALGLSLYDNNRHHIQRVATAINGDGGKIKYWIQAVVSSTTIPEMESILEFCLSIGCENVQLSNCVPFNGGALDQPIYDDNEAYKDSELRLKSKYSKKLNISWVNLLPRAPAARACAMPFSYVHVDNRGNLGACCMRAPDGKLYGNIYEDPDAWNKPYYQNLRKSMLDNKTEAMDVCRNCDSLHRDLYRI
jgi:radical SAM protein with 4Fe4S-binding SPASM domain